MTQKIFKIIFILLLIFSFCISYVSATDINLNLPNTTNNVTSEQENIDSTDNVITNEQDESIQDDENLEDTANIQDDTIIDEDTSYLSGGLSESLQASDVSTAPESGLSITNIINILLITVGVILILLAIAIMIRLKN